MTVFPLGTGLLSYEPRGPDISPVKAACQAKTQEVLSETRLTGWDAGRDPLAATARPC